MPRPILPLDLEHTIPLANSLGSSNKCVDTSKAKQYYSRPLEVSTREKEKGFRFHLTDVAAQRSVDFKARGQLPEPKHVEECSPTRLVPLLVHASVAPQRSCVPHLSSALDRFCWATEL